jgi:hypothetical protein
MIRVGDLSGIDSMYSDQPRGDDSQETIGQEYQ